MNKWAVLLGPMAIWTAHFVLIWTAASVFGTSTLAKAITGILTVIALAALVFTTQRIARQQRDDPVDGWFRSLGLMSCAIAALSVVWQTVPALLL